MMMTFEKNSRILVLAAGIALAGCVNQPMTPVVAEPDLVSLRLAQSAEKASRALETMASIDQMREPSMPAPEDYSAAPPALTQLITVRWNGPVEQMAQTLAERAGMSFQVKGNRPSVPLIVSVDVYQRPLIEVLHELGLQVGRRADVSVNGPSNMIEIRYAPVDRT